MNFYKDTSPTVLTNDGDKVRMNDIAVNSKVIPELVDNGSKNLLRNVQGSVASNSRPTVTMNNDGTSFIISGKNNLSDAWFYRIGTVTFEPGTYVLSGNYFDTVSVILYNDIISGSNSWINRGTPVEHTFTESTTQTFYIRVDPGYDFGTGTTFEPMVCTKEAWDVSHEYIPYKYQIDRVFYEKKKVSTCPTTYGYTGVSFTVPAGIGVRITVMGWYSSNQPREIGLYMTINSTTYSICYGSYKSGAATLSVTATALLAAASTARTVDVYGAWAGSESNDIVILMERFA